MCFSLSVSRPCLLICKSAKPANKWYEMRMCISWLCPFNTINWRIQPYLTLKMTTAQVVGTSVNANNSPIQDYTHPGDHISPPYQISTQMLYFCLQTLRLPGGYSPTNGRVIYEESGMRKADVYDKAIELIKMDPRHNICQIVGTFNAPGFLG